MAKSDPVDVEIEKVKIENEGGQQVDGVRATCTKCDHVTESFGQRQRSINRCCALMRDECPLNEENFYKAPDAEDI
jgi:hypothetical protein